MRGKTEGRDGLHLEGGAHLVLRPGGQVINGENARVKKFIADNKYTFSVLYDEGFVEKCGVEGIPAKFVIDKKGKIQFKGVRTIGCRAS